MTDTTRNGTIRRRLGSKTKKILQAISELEYIAEYGPVDETWCRTIEDAIVCKLEHAMKALREGREEEGFKL